MTTPRQQLAEIKRTMDRDRRTADRERLRALRARIKDARTERRTRERTIKAGAREALADVRRRMKDLRRSLAEAAKAARDISRYVVPGARVRLGASRQAALASLARSHGELVHRLSTEAHEAQKDAAELRRAEGRVAKQKPRASAAELRAESDDEVRGNIPRELLPVFDARASKTKATDRMSRTEAFLQWVHDHAGDAARIVETAEENIDDLIEEEKQLAREMKKRKR